MGARRACLTAFLGLAAIGATHADVLSLKDGRMFDGVKLSREEGAVVIHFTNGDVRVSDDRIHDAIIQNDTSFVPETDEERAMVAKGFVHYEGEWMDPARRDRAVKKKVEEQQARIAEMKRVREWRNRHVEDTKNFHFESTAPIHVFESYRDLCEIYFTEFSKMWKVKKPREQPNLALSLHVDQEKYAEITGMGRALGFFKFLPPPLELHLFYDRLDPRMTEEVLYHEAGHYLQKLIDVEFLYPHWPGESLSEYYGASTWDPVKKKLTWGLVNEGRLAQIRNDISKDEWVGLEEMILGCQDRNFHDYSWGWSFVHMLLESSKYAKKFQEFFLGLAKARDIERIRLEWNKYQLKSVEGTEMLSAFMRYMGLKSKAELEALEKEWYDYIQKELTISSVRGLEMAAGFAYMREDRPKKAKRLWEEAIAGGTRTPLTYYRYANLLEEEGELDKARDNWRKAIVLDPVTPEFYIALGESLMTGVGKDKPEGKRLIGLALELEPDNLYLERNAKRILDD